MTLLELVKELNELVENDLMMAQATVNTDNTQIYLDYGEVITFGDDEEDYEDYDDVDESNYDPYMGCDFYETDWIGDDF